MKSTRICVALLTAALAVPAFSQVSVYIGTPPPPLRYERRGPPPGAGFVWVSGYWAPNGHHYRWVPGRWERAPFEGAYWSHPHYDHYQQGWEMHEGHWDHEDHESHHWDNERDHDDHH